MAFLLIAALPLAGIGWFIQKKNIRPLLSDSMSFDIKTDFLLSQNLDQVDVLMQGSSVALNNFHSQTLVDHLDPAYRFFNFSSWGLTMKNNREVLPVYIEQYRPKVVLMVSSHVDFEENVVPLCFCQGPQTIPQPALFSLFLYEALGFIDAHEAA